MVKKAIHYLSKKVFDELKSFPKEEQRLSSLVRLIPLCSFDPEIPRDLPEWAHDPYLFAFPDKRGPESWAKYDNCKNEWRRLTGHIGSQIIGVEFDLQDSDKAYVVDRSFFADFQYGKVKDKTEALRKYALSRVPAEKYDGQFIMPELIIENDISFERLKVNDFFEREFVNKSSVCDVGYKQLEKSLIKI